jgi:hypothetical protein
VGDERRKGNNLMGGGDKIEKIWREAVVVGY